MYIITMYIHTAGSKALNSAIYFHKVASWRSRQVVGSCVIKESRINECTVIENKTTIIHITKKLVNTSIETQPYRADIP